MDILTLREEADESRQIPRLVGDLNHQWPISTRKMCMDKNAFKKHKRPRSLKYPFKVEKKTV